jgi:hypothetical protein
LTNLGIQAAQFSSPSLQTFTVYLDQRIANTGLVRLTTQKIATYNAHLALPAEA